MALLLGGNMKFEFNLVDAVKIFGRFGIIKHMDKIDLGDIADVVIVRPTCTNAFNVYIMQTTRSGKVKKDEFADCFLVTAKKIYRQQDFPGADIMESMNRFYRSYMAKTYPDYAEARKRRSIQVDNDAEQFYGEHHYSY